MSVKTGTPFQAVVDDRHPKRFRERDGGIAQLVAGASRPCVAMQLDASTAPSW
jgi:hypothetical protein